MKQRSTGRASMVFAGAALASLAGGSLLVAQELNERAVRQIQAVFADKARRTPVERKLATPLLMAHRQSRGRAMVQGLEATPRVAARARVDAHGMVVVDIKAVVTEDLLQAIAGVGGSVISSHPSYEAVRARVPIRRIDAVAALPEVRFVRPRARFRANAGAQTSEGDVAHGADAARTIFGVDGGGVRVGVVSGWVASLDDRQATGDLPPDCADPIPDSGACVAVVECLAPPDGPCDDPDIFLSDEGTAMLEVIHDLAPGAQLVFATADGGIANFASNIQALRDTYDCDVIVDDITYFAESAFQDGPIAQAVSAVTNSGALYFSSAGNGNRLSAGTSGTWEGDFVDSQTVIPYFNGDVWEGLPVHSFNGLTGGSAANSDPLTDYSGDVITLQWSDPWGGATNDYDLFLFSNDFIELFAFSSDDQECAGGVPANCSPYPYEEMDFGFPGDRIVVVQWSGAARALRVDTQGGQLSIATDGATYGHNAAASAVTVAAADVATAGGGAFTGGAANPVETYSSDGPRHIFFNPNGTAITPGNLLFGSDGGREVQKPDVTAADCVTTTTPGYSPFCGTSASAPHAAAIAALLLSTDNNPSGGQALAAMFTTALDVNPPGRDKDSGVGIVMADDAGTALTTLPATDFYTITPCRSFDTRQAGGPTSGAPLTCGVDYDFAITGGACGVPATARAISLNVTVTGTTSPGNLRLFAAGAPSPQVSNVNYSGGQTRGNNAVAPLSASGQMAVRCAPAGTTHVIVDVNGYFQ